MTKQPGYFLSGSPFLRMPPLNIVGIAVFSGYFSGAEIDLRKKSGTTRQVKQQGNCNHCGHTP